MMDLNSEFIDDLNKKIIDYDGYSLRDLLDHIVLLSWFQYIAHKAANVPGNSVNFDNRPFIQLPSGRKVRISMKVEDITDEVDRMDIEMINRMIAHLETRKNDIEKDLNFYYEKRKNKNETM